MIPAPPPEVAAVFASFPTGSRQGLLVLRQLILEQAAAMPDVGPLTEALRWGQPAYLTDATKSGTTLRLGVPKTGGFAIYAHCQTSLIADLALVAGGALRFDGNRAVVFAVGEAVPADLIGLLVRRALIWHRRTAAG